MSQQGPMIDDDAPEVDEPVIVFTMPSLRAVDDAVDDAGDLVVSDVIDDEPAADSGAVIEPDAEPEATPEPPQQPHQAPGAVLPDGTFAPPTADTRAEYMYALVEAERARILAAADSHQSLRDRLGKRRK